ncbi:hypothetical protein [Bradyrhizobium sp. 62B]|uniref:hypothetical protein n=1 Tax=Bradyrhizobium sp. 62B TaxID=2898442 RepID=UPI002557CB28
MRLDIEVSPLLGSADEAACQAVENEVHTLPPLRSLRFTEIQTDWPIEFRVDRGAGLD